MKRIKIAFALIFCLIFNYTSLISQEKKNNPIVYANVILAASTVADFNYGLSINYQKKTNLFSFRHINSNLLYFFESDIDFNGKDKKVDNYSEFSFLYGKRFIKSNYSYSFLLGVSFNDLYYIYADQRVSKGTSFIGLPFEIGFNFFKREKAPLSFFNGSVPFGKPTGFGRSFGIKFYGNIAKKSYVGIGLTAGFGWHKVYKN